MRHIPRWFLKLAATIGQQPRVALALDTQDLTFKAPAAQLLGTRQTDVRSALTGTPSYLSACVRPFRTAA